MDSLDETKVTDVGLTAHKIIIMLQIIYTKEVKFGTLVPHGKHLTI